MTTPTDPATQDPEALFRAALALHQGGKAAEAAAAYEGVLAVAPGHFSARLNLGVALRRLGRRTEALAAYDLAIAQRPASADAHNNRGGVLTDLRRLDEARESFEEAIRLKPGSAAQHLNLGNVLRDLGRPAEALAAYQRAAALAPQDASAHAAAGLAFYDLGRDAEAADAYRRALDIRPDAETFRRLALALKRGGHLADAAEAYRQSLALAPDAARTHNELGSLLFNLDETARALESFERAAALEPDFAIAHSNRGVALRKLGRRPEALAAYDRAVDLDPAYADARWHRSLLRLLDGRFAEGWEDYAWRWRVDGFVREAAAGLPTAIRDRFDPGLGVLDVAGRNILVVGEQGVGDVIMFASILPDLDARAASVSLVCEARLHALFASSFPAVHLIDIAGAQAGLATFDVVLPMGDLGRLFRNRPEDFPARAYLAPTAAARQAWARRLGPAEGRKRIGLSWRGGVARTGGETRSIPPSRLAPILDLPGCEFVSLQYGDVAQEMAGLNAGRERPVRWFPAADIDDFDQLAGLVANLDLVVSVQTALAHLCGATGAPALVMVPRNPEWRYTAASPTMPWYGSVRLFRQGPDADWDPVIREVAAVAQDRLGPKA